MKNQWIRWGLVAMTLVTWTGCYRYVPAQIEATPPGTDVQLLITRNGARQAQEAGVIGVDDEPRVRGTVVGIENESLLVRVPMAQRQDGFIVNRIDQSIDFPIGEIVSFQRREINSLATGLVVGGAAIGLGALVALVGDALRGGSGDTDPGPDEFFLLSIPIDW